MKFLFYAPFVFAASAMLTYVVAETLLKPPIGDQLSFILGIGVGLIIGFTTLHYLKIGKVL